MSLTNRQKKTGSEQTSGWEQENFDVLFHKHWDRICMILYHLLGDWQDAEDLALKTFLRLYEKPPRRQVNMGGWLYRVAVNAGLNALRANKSRQRYEHEAGVIYLENTRSVEPESALDNLQEQEQVWLVLKRMKPRSAKLLILRYSGLSYTEIAAALQVSAGSVGTLLARAEREFEKMYEE
jgi:RNA polymerase sigma-70 factor (ECF subfamily)